MVKRIAKRKYATRSGKPGAGEAAAEAKSRHRDRIAPGMALAGALLHTERHERVREAARAASFAH